MVTRKAATPAQGKQLGAVLDELFKLREKRKMLDAQSAVLKEQERAIEDDIFVRFKKAELEGARGKLAQASIRPTDVGTLDDWDAFEKHLRKHPEDLDLLQRRLANDAVRARWADKRVIPGVGRFTKISLSLTRVKRK